MPIEDADRWNDRYKKEIKNNRDQPSLLLVEHTDILSTGGLALDVAMGIGANAGYLNKLGYHVIGVDISKVAVQKAITKHPNLMPVIADLENFYIPPDTFEVIINFLYLQRNLWQPMVSGLKIKGILFIECLIEDMHQIHPEINPMYLLKRGELLQAFMNDELSKLIEIMFYDEGWLFTGTSHRRAVSRLIVQRYA